MKLMIAAVLVAATAATAAAQPSGSTASNAESLAANDCARARKAGKACVLTFGEEDIEGGVIKPDGEGIDARGISTFGSLLHLRRDFIVEIIRAADDV